MAIGPATLVLSLVLLVSCTCQLAAAACQDLGSILVVLNGVRSAHGAPMLAWDGGLNKTAQTRALNITSGLKTCMLPTMANMDGENAAAMAKYANMVDPLCVTMASTWLGGEQLYHWGAKPFTGNQAQLVVLQPWVQAVWASTTVVGCATTSALGGACSVLVCEFGTKTIVKTDAAFLANVLPIGGLAPPPAPPSTGCSNISQVLVTQNLARADHRVRPLQWNTTLATLAQARANNITAHLKDCLWADWQTRPGEILWSSTPYTDASPPPACDAANYDWTDQSSYNYASKTPYTDMVNDEVYEYVKAFTQTVWQGTTSMGCATAMGSTPDASIPACYVLVCLYNTPGNTPLTDKAFVENVLPPGGLDAPPPPVNGTGCTDTMELLSDMNMIRALHYAAPLTWSTTMATKAKTHAGSVLKAVVAAGTDCVAPANVTYPEGTSVFVFPQAVAWCDVAVGWWAMGEQNYKYANNAWDANKPRMSEWQDFAQMVWQNTTTVGCAVTHSENDQPSCQVVVCQYYAPGLQPQTNAAFRNNVQEFIKPDTYNYTGINSTVCTGMEAVPAVVNLARLAHSAHPVVWDKELVVKASTRAVQVAASSKTCSLADSSIQIAPGESIFLDTWTSGSAAAYGGAYGYTPPCVLAVSAWAGQESLYSFAQQNFTTSQQWFSFSQMVWANSSSFGCEAALRPLAKSSNSCLAIVCKYLPLGNTPQTAAAYTSNVHQSVLSDTGAVTYPSVEDVPSAFTAGGARRLVEVNTANAPSDDYNY